MATYAIGDVQGCYDELMRLLERIQYEPARDRLWLVGDLINRGPKSPEVLRFVRGLGDRALTVLGNHDLHFLAVAYGVRKQSKYDTLDELLSAPDRDDLVAWLRQQPLLVVDQSAGYLMVHAGVVPDWDLKTAIESAHEVERALRGEAIAEYLAAMYGNEPARFDQALQGLDRLRVITNILTRMRFCAADGSLELTVKAGPGDAPGGFLPWYAHPHRKLRGLHILFGHWAALEGRAMASDVTPLDTGCVWGSQLSALRLEDRQLTRCDCAR